MWHSHISTFFKVLATKFANGNTASVELDTVMFQVFLYDNEVNFVNGKVYLHWLQIADVSFLPWSP